MRPLAALVVFEPAPDELAPFLELSVGQGVDGVGDAERGPDARHVRSGNGPGFHTHLQGDAIAVTFVEVDHDVDDLGDHVDVGRHDRQGAVEEEHVLHVEHELLGHARPVPEEPLGEVPDLGGELLRRETDGVDRGPVETEVADHGVDVDVARQRAQVAHRRDLSGDVVGGRRDHQTEKGQTPGFVETTGDAEVEQRHAAVGLHEQVAAVEVPVEHPVEQRTFQEGDQRGVQHRLGVDPRRRAWHRRPPTRSRRDAPSRAPAS